jgi:hypothetical protein
VDPERITYAYHGVLLDKNRREIRLDLATIAGIQDSMITVLKRGVDTKTLQSMNVLLAQVGDARQDDLDQRVLINDQLIGGLLPRVPEQLRARFGWRYRLLHERMPQFDLGRLDPAVLEALRRQGFVTQPDSAAPAATTYLDECRSNQVPTPPDWPDSVRWVSRGALDPSFNFIGSTDTRVYTYNDANGVCYALPRVESGLMGIICQSQATGKACFYDNIDRDTGTRIDWRTSPLTMAHLKNGSELSENCTNCHRGDNVFLIHPGSTLQVPGLDANPAIRYTPIGQSNWSNPGPLAMPPPPEGQESCTGCHDLPDPLDGESNPYCRLLQWAAQNTMPPGEGPAGWPARSGSPYEAHIAFLQSRCLGF